MLGRRRIWSSAQNLLLRKKVAQQKISKVDLIEKIESQCNVGLNVTQYMPETLIQRVSSLLKERSHTQLEMLKQKFISEIGKKRFPWDSHNEQIGRK